MSNLMRLPHEISLWEDVLTVVDNDGNEYSGFVDISKVEVAAQYYKEKKLCVISSDKIESPTYAVDPALVRKTDGTSTLTFSIYAKYWDEESGELVDNPFIQYLTNERKVKLKYFPNGELRWLDLVIKKIDESSENYKFTYTATDLFINELSKSGYNLEFDMELENNQGPVNELASKVLAGTDWVVGADSELLQQTTTEALYEIVLTKDIKAKDIFTEKEITIPAQEKIYTFYSIVTNKTYNYFQFIYNKNGIYTADENGILYNAGNYYTVLSESDLPYVTYTYKNDYRGERYVRSPKTIYDETIGRYVNVYNSGTRYGYSDDKYISPALVNNLITNGSHIISNTGWFQQETAEVKTEMLPTYKEVTYYEGRIFGLEFVKNANNTFIVNSGFKDNVSKIGSIAKNDKFIFRVKGGLPVTDSNITTGLDMGNIRFGVEVSAYKINEDTGAVEKISGTTLFSGQAALKGSDGYYYTNEMSANRAVSQEELTDVLNQRYGIFITITGDNGTYYIQEVELFASVKDKNGYIILPNGKLLSGNQVLSGEYKPEAYVDTTYYYYDPNSETNKKATDPTQIEYEYVGKRALESYIPTYVANFEKIRGITAKETNRFNLLQSLSETFECWCRFDVLHKENGEIALGRDVAQTILSSEGLGSNGIFYTAGTPTSHEALSIVANSIKTVPDQYKQQKFVTFHKRVGQQKNIGFTYGINLKSVSRSLDSNDIATKLIVKNNSNKYADIGSCSIARANVNPSGENFILDFSHYVRQGLMNYTNIQNDLYSTDSDRGWIGLYARLKNLNNSRDSLVAKQSSLIAELSKHKSDYESSSLLYDSTNKEFSEQIRYYHGLTGWTYGEIEKELEKIKNDTTDEAEEIRKNLQGWLDDKKVIATVTNIERLREEQKKHDAVCVKAKESLDVIEEDIKATEEELDDIKASKTEFLSKFEKKYGRFLQEASWISDDHTDDNLYYFDAETTLHNSAQPKVSYTINIVELSQLEGYEGYNFELGDITYVQDTDFFGWIYENGFKTPYKEEIVITEMTTYFNSPEKNVLKAKNYRDQFEDLFQRMAASSQQLQFHSGAYDRAADAVSSDGNILPQALSDAFANNAYVLSNIANQSVKWDEYGITTTDTTNPADIVRVTSGGIYLTEDGGRNWTTGISASGINAKTITTGQLDTGAVTIMSGDQTAFRWDDSGINAFKEVPDGEGGYQRSSQTYVRFDEHGLYGINGQANFDPKEMGANGNTGIDRINDEAKFALTWDGFVLNSGKGDPTSRIKISDKEDFQLYRTVTNFVTDSEGNFVTDSDGNPITKTEEQEAVRIGRLGNNNSVGMQVNVSKTDTTRPVIIGDTGLVDGEHGKLVFRAGGGLGETDDNAPFRVYEDGFFYAKNVQIGGTLTPAQLRDISISLSYSGEVDGNSVLLTCSPTIAKDELDAIVWKIDDVSIASEATVRLDYDRIKEIYEGKKIPDSGIIKLTVAAQVSGDGDADDSNGESREGEIDVDITNIFKTETAYAIGESGTVYPAEDEWGTELPAFEPGKYCWMRVSNIFVVGDPQTRYEVTYFGKDGADVRDLNLKASSLVFIKDKEGNISPEEIYFEAVLQNYNGEGSFKWVGANAQNDGDKISNTAILTKDDFGDSKVRTVSVDYGDLHDEVTIALLDDGKDGESAISVVLSNPVMTFDANIVDQKEETQVYVYFGTTEIKDFTLTPDDSGVAVDGSKIIINNPMYSTTKQVLLSATINGKTYEQIIPIKCLVTDTGYRVELTNDGASIGVDSDGNPAEGSLQLVSSTSVEVYFGSQDITGSCEFYWSANGGELNTEGPGPRNNYFTKLTKDSATATVTVTYDGKVIGEKTFVITKVYAGAAVSFKLNTSFTSVNSKQTPKVVTLQVLKIIGSQTEDITEELGQSFEIKADNVVLSSKSYSISQTTTFTLEIGETVWDTETVAVVHDGQDGGKGDPAQDLNLTASSYVFVKHKDTSITPSTITLTAKTSGLSGGSFDWSGADLSGGDTAYLIAENLGTNTAKTVGVSYTDGNGITFTDTLTILLVEDGPTGPAGEPALQVYLTNPTMTFNSSDTAARETCEVIAYYGTEKINYDANPGDELGYKIQSVGTGASHSNGVITVTNPRSNKIIQVTVRVYLGSPEKFTDIPLSIICTVVNNGSDAQDLNLTADSLVFKKSKDNTITPTSINLTAKTANLTGGQLKWFNTDNDNSISTSNTLSYTTFGASAKQRTIIAQYVKNDTVYFEDSITIMLVEDGNKGNDGKSAFSVGLTNPTMTFNSSNTSATETCKVIAYYGTTSLPYGNTNTSVYTQHYRISESSQYITAINSSNGTITVKNPQSKTSIDITVFLYDGSGSYSSQTLTIHCNVVENGEDGSKGDTVAHVYAYIHSHLSSAPSKPTSTPSDTAPNTNQIPSWTFVELEALETNAHKYVYRSEGVKTVSGTSTSYSDWQTPELYRAWNNVNVDQKNYAEYLKLTNFGESGLYYNGGKLYVNADHIKVTSDGSGSTGDVVFEAAGSSKTVFIAGWTASNNALYTSNNTLYLGTTGITANIGETNISNLVFKAGSNFGVDSNGALYAASGSIGGFTIGQINLTGTKRQSLYYNLVATSSGNDIISSSMVICPQGLYRSTEFLGQTGKYWKMIVGTNFGVDSTGTLHAKAANISGNLVNTAIVNDKEQTVKIKEGYLECNQKFGVTDATRMITSIGDIYSRNAEASDFYISCSNTLGVFVIGHEIGTQIQFTCVKSNGVVGSSAKLIGSWFTQAGSAVTSDRTKKNNIAEIDESYGLLFDNLVPVTYKYNDGTSGRIHTGFIAQDVCLAIEQAGLSTSEFAGYVVATMPNLETGEEETTGYLRYEEFISLNTWQIQKLKPRMTAAEQEIETLKLEIERLRVELESLK